MTEAFFKVIESRRSVYGLTKKSSIPDAEIEEIVKNALLHVPSTFNIQSGRAVLLLGENADKVWDLVGKVIEAQGPEAVKEKGPKLAGFKMSYGTILFFEDSVPIKVISDKIPAYAAMFPSFSSHSAGMIQHTVWCALSAVGMGASLQHLGFMIDKEVKELFGLPETWEPVAMMPFGIPLSGEASGLKEKTFLPLEGRFKSFA